MVHGQNDRAPRRGHQCGFEPGQALRAEAAVVIPIVQRIQPDDPQRPGVHGKLPEARQSGVAHMPCHGGKEGVTDVVIARNGVPRHLQTAHDLQEVIVLRLLAVMGEITGHQHEFRSDGERVDPHNRRPQSGSGIIAVVDQRAGRDNVSIGNLDKQHGSVRTFERFSQQLTRSAYAPPAGKCSKPVPPGSVRQGGNRVRRVSRSPTPL